MPITTTQQQHAIMRRLFNGRVAASVVFILLALGLVIMRLYWLQITDHAHYTTLSTENRLRLLPRPPARGEIADRNGILLAENIPSIDLFIFPDKVKNLEETTEQLSQVIPISDDDRSRFDKLKKRHRRFERVPIRTGLNQQEMAKFAVKRHRFQGVDMGITLRRFYPYGELTAHVVGYIGRINERELESIDQAAYSGTSHIGKTGLERYYEDQLHGEVGIQKVEMDATSHIMRVIETQPPVNGKDIKLHFDIELQRIAMDGLGEHSGAVVAIDIKSGGILVLASKPGFDANLFVDGISFKDYDALRENPETPLYNRTIHGRYPPGSTIKPFLALAGLERGNVTANQTIWCPGHYNIKGSRRKFRDWKKSGHGTTNLYKAIEQSCDVYFYNLAYSMGIDNMHDYLSQFRFGQKTGADMPNETGAVLPSIEWKKKRYNKAWLPGDTVNAGIGQGYVLVSPLQLAYATAVLAGDGKLLPPRLASHIDDISTALADSDIPRIEKKNPLHWEQVIQGMSQVVEAPRGTAKRIRSKSYRIAGKTGTAQVVSMKQNENYDAEKLAKEKHDHALFVAFAPTDDPQIAVAVIVEHGGHGGSTAAPIARQIMDAFLLEESVETEQQVSSEEITEKEKTEEENAQQESDSAESGERRNDE
ncbi:MAG TPA: penicillin-binding protein 2 [Gammaproteobacteria bacterium]|nr:penicillin-binding protein 2 [Gammaproteobacteria bacterium]